MEKISIDREVMDYIAQRRQDFRLSTSCYGPVIVPVDIKPPKESDLKIRVGNNTLYISRVQARYVKRITMSMIYDISYLRSCPVLRE